MTPRRIEELDCDLDVDADLEGLLEDCDGDVEPHDESTSSSVELTDGSDEARRADDELEHDEQSNLPLLRRLVPGRRRVWWATLVAVTIGAMIFTGVLAFKVNTVQAKADSGRTAQDAAANLIPTVLSYQFKDLDTALAHAEDCLTGQFKDDFTKLVNDAVRPAAVDRKISTQTTVQATGLVQSSRDDATVLMYINQQTTALDQQTPKLEAARLRVDLKKVDGRWLISAINPI